MTESVVPSNVVDLPGIATLKSDLCVKNIHYPASYTNSSWSMRGPGGRYVVLKLEGSGEEGTP